MNDQATQKRQYLYGHTSQETAYIVQDYPWGFRLRTTIRYWIESKDSKNGGQRFASQTINPKTGQWCAPKYSTYSAIVILYLDHNGHVQNEAISNYTQCKKTIMQFKEDHLENLNKFQKQKLIELNAVCNVMHQVTFTVTRSEIGPVSLFSRDPIEIEKRKQLLKESEERAMREKESLRQINKAIGYELNKVKL